jgi:hypothetical protein
VALHLLQELTCDWIARRRPYHRIDPTTRTARRWLERFALTIFMVGFIDPIRNFGGIEYRQAIKAPTALTRKNFRAMAAAVFVGGNMRRRIHDSPESYIEPRDCPIT